VPSGTGTGDEHGRGSSGSDSGGRAGGSGDGVSLVVHRRIDAAQDAAYAAWQARVEERLAARPGFVRRETFPPNPPFQDDWIVIEHFRDLAAVREWLQSDDRRALLGEVNDLDVGNDELHIVSEDGRRPERVASVLISTKVDAGREAAFVAWQREISEAEARFDGFLGHRVERPVPGVQDEWVTVLTFDAEEHLDAWIDSSERAELVRRGGEFGVGARLTKSSYGFGFWSKAPEPDPVFHSNLIVLLVLYPVVFLWGYFVAEPLLDSHGVPFWLSLFIGNLVSTQLLGWFLAPWAFRMFRWWTHGLGSVRTQVLGYLLLAALYAASMALYAWLLSLR